MEEFKWCGSIQTEPYLELGGGIWHGRVGTWLVMEFRQSTRVASPASPIELFRINDGLM